MIWDAIIENDFALPDEKPLTLVSYAAGDYPEAFVEPLSFADRLPDMPLLLSSGIYVPVPLESSYQTAWEAMPTYWRNFLSEPEAKGKNGRQQP